MSRTSITNSADLGRAVRAAREAREWSQEVLARHAGVQRITVTRFEGGTPVNSTTLFKVLGALDLHVHLRPSKAPR